MSVVKDFAPARVLQILVNLISNAKHAMDGIAQSPHRMTLGIELADHSDGPGLGTAFTLELPFEPESRAKLIAS